MKDSSPIVNVHTHIFTYEDIPPYIAKKFVPWPLYYFTHVHAIFGMLKWIRNIKRKLYKPKQKRIQLLSYINAMWPAKIAFSALVTLLLLNAIWFIAQVFNNDLDYKVVGDLFDWLRNKNLIYDGSQWLMHSGIIVFLILFSRIARKIIWSFLKFVFKPLANIPDKKWLGFLRRYLLIAEIVKYQHPRTAYNKLKKMYPKQSRFVVLPMDMEFMAAGKPIRKYLEQLEGIDKLINHKEGAYKNLLPFIFVDPRRIRKEKDNDLPFFDWQLQGNLITLKPCILKQYLEVDPKSPKRNLFAGIKLYPALGYYPFDQNLLPLYLYCIQKNIPITTHTTIGTIFYRGSIKKSYFHHPVFTSTVNEITNPMQTFARSNYELQKNFTHPLNYLVLLEPYFLKKWVKNLDSNIQNAFGYNPETDEIKRNLSNLKINFAHYGGEEEWTRYLEADRDDYSQELIENPKQGLQLCRKQVEDEAIEEGEFNANKPSILWEKNVDWYSIISSMMLQYPNVYSDISYTLHNPEIKTLLHFTLQNPHLAKKVLFGTDYHVVRNHKSEKELLADMMETLDKSDFDQIARFNTANFLQKRVLEIK